MDFDREKTRFNSTSLTSDTDSHNSLIYSLNLNINETYDFSNNTTLNKISVPNTPENDKKSIISKKNENSLNIDEIESFPLLETTSIEKRKLVKHQKNEQNSKIQIKTTNLQKSSKNSKNAKNSSKFTENFENNSLTTINSLNNTVFALNNMYHQNQECAGKNSKKLPKRGKKGKLNYHNSDHIRVYKQPDPIVIQIDPIKYKMNGLVDHFNEIMPNQLIGKLSPAEFKITIKKINKLLKHEIKKQTQLMLLGSIFCVCTVGLSYYPCYNKSNKTLKKLKNLLDSENDRIYVKMLDMKWSLIIRQVNRFLEYNMMIEFIPRYNFTMPD